MTFGGNFCPRGWAATDGQLLAISQYSALFSLLGTTFGGDGRSTFGLPDLRGRAALGNGHGPGLTPTTMGDKRGFNYGPQLTEANLPSHNHLVNANNLDGDKPGPGGKLLAAAPPSGAGSETIYSDKAANRQMSSEMIALAGSSSPTELYVKDPYLVMTRCIALEGIFPSRN